MATIVFVISFVLIQGAATPPGQPDLVIEHVSYEVVVETFPYGEVKPTVKGEIRGQLNVVVRNIGTAVCHEPFYISANPGNTSLINRERGTVGPNESITLTIRTRVHSPGTLVQLILQPDSIDGLIFPRPRIEESHFENNSFDFVIPED